MKPAFKPRKRTGILSTATNVVGGRPPIHIAQKATKAKFERTARKSAPEQKPMPIESTKPEELTPQQKRMRALLTGKPQNPKFTKSRFLKKP